MIAPIKQSDPDVRTRLNSARQAVAAVLLDRVRPAGGGPRVSRAAAAVFLLWLAAVAVSYFLVDSWWSLRVR